MGSSDEAPSSAAVTAVETLAETSNGKQPISPNPAELDPQKALELAAELFAKGSKAIEDGDFSEAVDCLSRSLETRVAHYGELASECALSYYKYGCALLYKSQEEADPLGNVLKNAPRASEKNGTEDSVTSKASATDANNRDASSGSNKAEEAANEEAEEVCSDRDQDDADEGSDGEEVAEEADEDESDLDLAWKMLDVARAIVEKSPEDSMEKVNILAALGEVSMEREDIETSLNDYQKALSILERLVEPDGRRIVELNFRICLVLEVGSKIEEAIPYCQKAISLCKSRLQRLRGSAVTITDLPGSDKGGDRSCGEAGQDPSVLKDDEISVLSDVFIELERKLEDLQQAVSNPKSVLSEFMKMVASKSASTESTTSNTDAGALSVGSSQMGVISGSFSSPATSTAATTNGGVTHLGVVGRGIKRAVVHPSGAEPPAKKSLPGTSSEKDESNVSEVVDDSAAK